MKKGASESTWMIAFTIAVAILSAAVLGGTNHAIAGILGVADKIDALTAGFRTQQAAAVTESTPNQQIQLSYGSTIPTLTIDSQQLSIPVDSSDPYKFNLPIANQLSLSEAEQICITSSDTVTAASECDTLLCQTDKCITRNNKQYTCQGGAWTTQGSREYSHTTDATNCQGPTSGSYITIDSITCPEAVDKGVEYTCNVEATYRCNSDQWIKLYDAQTIENSPDSPQTYEEETPYPCTGNLETITHTFTQQATDNQITAITGYRSSFTSEEEKEVLIR